MTQQTEIALFAYGTLQQSEVQLATFGRLLEGVPDVLAGYKLETLDVSDPEVVRLSGTTVHQIARKSGEAADCVAGTLFLIGEDELVAADLYEVDAYERAEVALVSGALAFAYVGASL